MKVFRKSIWMLLAAVLVLAGCGKKPADEIQPTSEAQPVEASLVSIETVTTDDFSMDYCRFGKGERTLVILPGLSIQNVLDSADAIADAYQLLTDEFTIYVFERRNDLPPVYTVSDMARDTAAAFEAIGLKDINLFGASYGGMATMDIAIHHPELVDKIILASTSANLTDEEYQTVEKWIGLAKEGDAEKLYLAFGEAVYPEDVFEQSQDLLVDAAKSVTEEDLQKFITLAEGMKGFTVAEELDQLQCPVLAIGDQQDKVLGPQAIENIGKVLEDHSGFELYMYDGYGHAVYDMAPDFKDRMLAFLDSKAQ